MKRSGVEHWSVSLLHYITGASLFLLGVYFCLLDIFIYSSQLLVTTGFNSIPWAIAWVQSFLLTNLHLLETVRMSYLRLFQPKHNLFFQPVLILCSLQRFQRFWFFPWTYSPHLTPPDIFLLAKSLVMGGYATTKHRVPIIFPHQRV